MGCCNSNIRKQNYSEILVEERVIQGGERQLFFSSRPFTEILKLIESLHQISSDDISSICETFGVALSSPSGSFLQNLSSKGQLSAGMLRSLAILLCPNDSKNKTSQVMSYSKDNLIDSIKDLIAISIDIIPENLENLEKSALLYANSLKSISHEYVRELDSLSFSQIQEILKDFVISSKDIRIKMFNEMKNSNLSDSFADKLDHFRADTEGKEEDDKEESLNPKSSQHSREVSHLKQKSNNSCLNNEKVAKSEGIEEEFEIDQGRKVQGNELNEVEVEVQVEAVVESQVDQELKDDKQGLDENEEIEVVVESKVENEDKDKVEVEVEDKDKDKDKEQDKETATHEIEIYLNPALGKNDVGSPSGSTPATYLNEDLDSIKSPQEPNDEAFKDDTKLEASKNDESQNNPFGLAVDCQVKSEPASDLSSPRLVPRKSSGLAAKLKATQAFIRTGNINRADTSPEFRNSLTGDSQAFTKRRVKQEPFVMDRKSLTSPKSAIDPSRLPHVEESKD